MRFVLPRLFKRDRGQIFSNLNIAHLVTHEVKDPGQILVIYRSPRFFVRKVRAQQSAQKRVHFCLIIRRSAKSITVIKNSVLRNPAGG
jgi:hypothetical protein